MTWIVATEKPRLRPCVMYIPIGPAFVPIRSMGWECIGEFKGDFLIGRGLSPTQAFSHYQKECKRRRPMREKLADWIKS